MEDQQKITEMEAKINALEKKLSSSIIYDNSLFKRALGVFGHNILAQLILFIPMMLLFAIIAGLFLPTLFFPDILDQGW